MRFLVESTFAQAPTSEQLALLPQETARGLELDAAGIREALYLAIDQSRGWQVYRVESRSALDSLLESFPLYTALIHTVTELIEPAS